MLKWNGDVYCVVLLKVELVSLLWRRGWGLDGWATPHLTAAHEVVAGASMVPSMVPGRNLR